MAASCHVRCQPSDKITPFEQQSPAELNGLRQVFQLRLPSLQHSRSGTPPRWHKRQFHSLELPESLDVRTLFPAVEPSPVADKP